MYVVYTKPGVPNPVAQWAERRRRTGKPEDVESKLTQEAFFCRFLKKKVFFSSIFLYKNVMSPTNLRSCEKNNIRIFLG